MASMIRRRRATAAGRTLNEVAAEMNKMAQYGQLMPSRAREIENAVRVVNAVAYQYYLIPRDVREMYFREDLLPEGMTPDGV